MIQTSTALAAVAFANKFANEKKTLTARQGSILSTLVGLSYPTTEYVVRSEDELSGWASFIEGTTSGSLETPSQHSLESDALVKQLSDLVRSHLSYAKNVVKPLVVDFAKSILEFKNNYKAKDATEDLEIRVQRIPSVLNDAAFLDNLKFYQDRSILIPDESKKLNLPVKTTEELMQLVMTGHDRTDKLIVEWMSCLDSKFLKNIWDQFFTSAQLGWDGVDYIYGYEGIASPSLSHVDRLNVGLAFYLFSRKIYDDVQESGMSLNAYKDAVSQYRDYAGALIVDSLKKIQFASKNKTLVFVKDSYSKVIKVNGELYNGWLESGGSPEVLFGLMLENSSVSSIPLIDNKANEFKARWNSYCSYFKISQENKSFDHLKDFLLTGYLGSFNNQDDVEKEFLLKNPNHIESSRKKVEEFLNGLKKTDVQDDYELSLILIAKIRFSYTSSYQLLSDINEVAKANPNIDVREAALLATINYVSDYFANQVTLSNG